MEQTSGTTCLFKRKEQNTSFVLRADKNKLAVPFPRTNFFKQSINYNRANLWSNFPFEKKRKEQNTSFVLRDDKNKLAVPFPRSNQ